MTEEFKPGAEVQPDGSVRFDGPPITPEMQTVFGGFGCGLRVTGIVVFDKHIVVSYDDGLLKMNFVPVMDGVGVI